MKIGVFTIIILFSIEQVVFPSIILDDRIYHKNIIRNPYYNKQWNRPSQTFNHTAQDSGPIDNLIEKLGSQNSSEVNFAKQELIKMGSSAIDPLIEVIKNGTDNKIRRNAVDVLVNIDYDTISSETENKVVNALLDVLKNEKDLICEDILFALIKLEDKVELSSETKERMVTTLLDLFNKGDEYRRISIIFVLNDLNYTDVSTEIINNIINIVLDNLQDESWDIDIIRNIAYILYEVFQTNNTINISSETIERVINVLLDFLKKEVYSDLSYIGLCVLYKIDYSSISSETKHKVINWLLEIVKNKDNYWRTDAVSILAEIIDDSDLQRKDKFDIFFDLFNIYDREEDRDMKYSLLVSIVTIAKTDSYLKNEVTRKLNLTDIQLEIWEKYNILTIGLEGRNFNAIKMILSVMPKEILKEVNVIGGMTFPFEVAANTGVHAIYINDINIIVDYMMDYALSHEIGHMVKRYIIDETKWREFEMLYQRSEKNRANFVSSYAMTNAGEDFAELFTAYINDSAGLLARALAQAEDNDPTNDVLLEKVKFIASLFSYQGEDGKIYTYIFSVNKMNRFLAWLGVDNADIVSRREVELGTDGLPKIR